MTGPGVPVGLSVPAELSGRGQLEAFSARARAVGFGTLLVPDRPAGSRPTADPISQATALRALSDWRMVTVCLVPYRHPLHLARTLANADRLSPEPVVLAAAMGGDYQAERRAFGVTEADQLTGLLEESVEICRRLWRGQPTYFQGEHYDIDGITVLPRPTRGTVPVWLAHRARSLASLERTARLADGWLASWVSPARLRRATEQIREAAVQLERDGAPLDVCALVRLHLAPTVEAAAQKMARIRSEIYGHPYDPALVTHLQVGGPVEYCLERLWDFVDAGATELVLQLECDPQDYEGQLSVLGEAIVAPSIPGGATLRR